MKEKKQKKKKRSLGRKILNGIILFFAGILFLLLLLIGFSQTSTFRELLRDKAVSIVNNSLNGEFSLGSIEGTIFTSLSLKDITLEGKNDTLASASEISVKISPMQLLLNEIYVREVIISDLDIKLLQYEDGTWNLNYIIPSGEKKEEKKKGKPFGYTIIVNNLEINNSSFIRQSYENRGSTANYEKFNAKDIQIRDINLGLQAALNLAEQSATADFKNFTANTNINALDFKKFSVFMEAEKDYAEISRFNFITDSTNFYLNARMDSLNIFDMGDMAGFKNNPVKIEADIDHFYFGNLSAFINSTNILNGRPSLYFNAEGTYGDLTVNLLRLDYLDTHIKLAGDIKNLEDPKNLYFDARIENSYVNYSNVQSLLPTLELPEYPELYISALQASYKGSPLNFSAEVSGNLPRGSLSASSKLDLRRKPIKYDVKFKTSDLNIAPVTGMSSVLNTSGRIAGKGTTPRDLDTELDLNVKNSSFEGYSIDSLKVDAEALSRIIDISLEGGAHEAYANLEGKFDFTNLKTPVYDFKGVLRNLDVGYYLDDSLDSDLNFDIYAKGKNTEIDSIEGSFKVLMDTSSYMGHEVGGASIVLELDADSAQRKIGLTSDFLDFNIEGDFSLNKAVSLLSYEGQTISKIIAAKIDSLNPIKIEEAPPDASPPMEISEVTNDSLKFDFDFTFKDFDLIATLLGSRRLEINGSGEGTVENDSLNFAISTDLDIDYFIMRPDTSSVMYISGLETNLNFSRNNRALTFSDLFGAVSVTGNRLYFGSNVENIEADLVFNQSELYYNLSARMDDIIYGAIEGRLAMEPGQQQFDLNSLALGYKDNYWVNKDTLGVTITPDSLALRNFRLYQDSAYIAINGTVNTNDNSQNIRIETKNLTGKLLNKNFLQLKDYPKGTIDISADITGTFAEPVIEASLDLKKFSYGKVTIGDLLTDLNYQDRVLNTDLRFISARENGKELLTLQGDFPVDLGFTGVEERFPQNEPIDMKLKSEMFKLSTLGSMIPSIREQTGAFSADVTFSGTPADPQYEGEIKIDNGYLISTVNNMDYYFNLDLGIKTGEISLNELVLKNTHKPEYQGEMTVNGKITLDGFEMQEAELNMNGELAVLSESSQKVLPTLYGTLFVGTEGEWNFRYREGRPFFKGEINLIHTDLTYVPRQAAYSSSRDDFNYQYVVDSSKINPESERFREIAEKNNNRKRGSTASGDSGFDYEITIDIVNDALFTFILSDVANQKLVVEASGDLTYISEDGEQRAQGAFELEEDSRLDFVKSLDATGTITFESDITNPYLDITATYGGVRSINDTEEQVQIRLRLVGPLNELGERLAENPENFISVYTGQNNIQNNNASRQYDAADAVSFIAFGSFVSDLTAGQRGQGSALQGTTNSILGSVLTSFVNSAVGDLVNSIEVSDEKRGAGEPLKRVTVSGRYGNIRYSVGGTSQVFDELEKANFKVAYLFSDNFLIRLERRRPPLGRYNEDNINELALQYRFEF